MPPRLRRLTHVLLDAVYPPACLLCATPLGEGPHEVMLCQVCSSSLTGDVSLSCPLCCSTVGPGIDVSSGCARCHGSSFAFDSAFRLGIYDGKLRDAILAIKHLSGESLAETLGLVWVGHQRARFEALGAQVVVPMPLHFLKRWWRGYNQSASLARMIGQQLGIPFQERWLKRIRNTSEQTNQSPAKRRENVRGAFRVSRLAKFTGLKVLLIDDVLTTGATASEAAKAICESGAKQVNLAVLGHR